MQTTGKILIGILVTGVFIWLFGLNIFSLILSGISAYLIYKGRIV